MAPNASVYRQILEHIFLKYYTPGATAVHFTRADIPLAATALGLPIPANLGDVIYSHRYRVDLPQAIVSRAPAGLVWLLEGTGRSTYAFMARAHQPFVTPQAHLVAVKIPDATPGIIAEHALSGEQALLAKVRYNRIIDLFTGIVCYSLQNHLRAYVDDLGQVETDEVYLGVGPSGLQYVIPVEAKGGTDRLSIVQINQDLALAKQKFEGLEPLMVAVQFIGDDIHCFLFAEDAQTSSVKLIKEKRYSLVEPSSITGPDLTAYRAALVHERAY
jgi:hypothetical protein